MRALVVVNPNATTTSPRTREVLLSALRHDLSLEVAETTHRWHAAELAQQAREAGADLVVSVGGDGTINEVVNGLLAPGPSTPVPALALVPGGSTNVLARNLGIPQDPVEATGLLLDALRHGRRQPIGLGRLDERYFTFAVGIGLDADVIHAVEEQRARGRTASTSLYVSTAARRIFRYPDRRTGSITLKTSGAEPVVGLATVVISNCTPSTYVGSIPLRPTPRADFSAGLDVFGLRKIGFPSALKYVGQLTSRQGPHGRHVVSLHDVDHLVLTSTSELPVQVDGDFIGRRERMVLTSAPRAVTIAY